MRGQVAGFVAVSMLSLAASARTEEREVPAFDEVQIGGGIHATISIGPRKAVRLEGDERTLKRLEVVVEDGALHVGFKQNSWRDGDSWHDDRGEVRVTIQTPDLHAVGASGGSIVQAELTRSDRHAVHASGGSEVHVRGVDARELSVNGSGGAVVEVAGRADALALHLSGGSHLKGRSLEVRDVDVEGSGGAQCELKASGKIRGGLSGGSGLHVRGNATSRVATSGGSTVDFDD